MKNVVLLRQWTRFSLEKIKKTENNLAKAKNLNVLKHNVTKSPHA